MFEQQGYEVALERPIPGDGFVDVVAERPGERVAVEIETGKSDIKMNLRNALAAKFDRVVLVAASPAGVAACQRAVGQLNDDERGSVELMTWLDVS
jgi:predicted RecB family endonuclease